MDMTRYRMTIAYDGTRYAGWQVQPEQITLQGELERAIGKICHSAVRVSSSGRTDAGVHARAQVAHFDLKDPIEPDGIPRALNHFLEPDIRVFEMATVAPDFDARRSATGKQYRYFIWDDAVVPPFLRLYRVHRKRTLDVIAMQEAASRFVGVRDFAAFTANPHRDVESTVRDLRRLDVHRVGHEVCILAEGEGFLYKMVRSLAGFLIRVGEGEQTAKDATEILESKVRTARVPTAQPHGLFLWEVYYHPQGRDSQMRLCNRV